MKKSTTFSITDAKQLNMDEYNEQDYIIGKFLFLSTRENSHGLEFSEDVLIKGAKSMLGKWVVSKIQGGDFTTHTPDESIIGIIPKEQDIEFIRAEDGYLDAYAIGVISKLYSKSACDIFKAENFKNVSIEFSYTSEDSDENKIGSFEIKAVTILGNQVRPSVPNAGVNIIRFSKEKANKYFEKFASENSLSSLKQFVEKRRIALEDNKTYKIDKSKDSVSDTPWGDVDKTALRNKIMSAKNASQLVKAVYMVVENGWQDAPSEKLKYPVMELKGDTFVYNKNALSSALGYAKAEDETDVVNRIEKIRKDLGLGEKEGKAKMNIKFDEIEGREAWAKVIDMVKEHEGEGVYVDSIEDDHIIYTKDNVRYRVQADIEVGDDDKFVKAEIHWDTVKKDADQKMSCEDMEKKIGELEKCIEERDNIIMEKDKVIKCNEDELSELREFKKTCMEKDRACTVEKTMSEIKTFISDEKFKELRDEGLNCDMEQVDAWCNKVKAYAFEQSSGKNFQKDKSDTMWFSAPVDGGRNTSGSLWK